MNARITILSAILTLALTSPVWAVKLLINVTPSLSGEALNLEMKSLEGGKTRFTITRDPSRARHPTNPDLTLTRGASLAVYSDQGRIVRCPVAARENRSGRLVYQFDLDDELAMSSRFTLSEIEDYKDRTGYIGGGTIYEFALIDFIDPDHEVRALRRRLEEGARRTDQQLKQFVERIQREGFPE